MTRKINYDRGVIIKIIKATGMEVYMYADNPGHYLSSHGNAVSEELAREAGYNTEHFAKLRMRKEKMAAASKAIEDELDIADRSGTKEVVLDRDGFKLIHYGAGRHYIEDPDGNNLTPAAPLPREAAERIFDQVVTPKPAPADAPVPPGRVGDGPGRVGTAGRARSLAS
jgi:hypothetical protein